MGLFRTVGHGGAGISETIRDTRALLTTQKFCSKDSRRAMGAAVELLESVGKGLKPSPLG
jgi:hypothetical protein